MNFTELKKKLRFVHNNTYLLNKAKSGTQISLGSKCTRSTSSYWLAFHVRNSLFQFWKWQEIFQSWQSICQMVLSNFYHSGKYQRSIFSGKPNGARWAIKYLLPPNFPHTLQPPSAPPPLKKKRVNGQASSLSTDTFKNAEVIIKFSQSIAYHRLSTLLKDRMSQLA